MVIKKILKSRTRIISNKVLERPERPSRCDEEALVVIESLDFVVFDGG